MVSVATLRRLAFAWAPIVLLMLLAASPAEAARRKRKTKAKKPAAAAEPLDIVVLPFEVLRGTEAAAARSNLELDLELVEKIRVQDGAAVAADLSAAKNPLDPAAIKTAMARRSIEILVAAPTGFERPHLVVFGADGKPRLIKELPRGAAADQVAATALAVIKPAIPTWSTLKPQKLPALASGDVDVSDVILGGGGRGGAGDDDDDDAPRGGRGDPSPTTSKRTAGLDTPTETNRRGAVDDSERDALDTTPRRTMVDVEESAGPAVGLIKESHLLALSGTFDGAAWNYSFAGNGAAGPEDVGAGFHPGGSLRADLWPVDFIGIDASAALSTVQFQINSSGTLAVTPNRFVSVHANAGASVKGRYLLRLSDDGVLRLVGIGARVGYRFWQGSVETQRIISNNRVLTVVPGFQLHGLAVGPELYVPLFIFDRRIEVELKVDTLPVTRYAESPDNPGQNSLAFGYHAELLTRFDLFGGFFVELAGKSTGATINFEGEGDRVTVGGNDNDLVTLKGGRSTNIAAGFSVGVGFMY